VLLQVYMFPVTCDQILLPFEGAPFGARIAGASVRVLFVGPGLQGETYQLWNSGDVLDSYYF
jgi:hypothetical protein